ncbi:MAG: OmpA family protein [Bryobacteraceae bacterium]
MRFSLLFVSLLTVWAQPADVKDSSDPFLFKRIPGFQITEFREEKQGLFPAGAPSAEPVQGHKTEITYRNTGQPISAPSIFQHYQRLALGLGGKVLSQTPQSAAFMVQGKTSEIWLAINSSDPSEYKLALVERGAAIPQVTPDDMLTTFEQNGRVALYVKFNMDEAVIKPESQELIGKAAELLKRSPVQRVSLEGHTDFVGNPETNKILSKARAQAVADALVKLGVDPQRLAVAGYGQERPLGDNKTDEGRAKNRRIELVNPAFHPKSASSADSHPKDAQGAKDHPLFPRLPSYYLFQSDAQDSTDVIFATGKPGEAQDVTVHGKRQDLIYRFDDLGGKPMPGPDQILKSYMDTARAAGGSPQYESSSAAVAKIGDLWLRVAAAGGEQYTLTIVTGR